MANLLHLKASRTQVLNTFPTRDFGKDGDIVISRITGRGVYLCTKAGNTWYVANKLEELRNIGKTSLKGLKVDNLISNNYMVYYFLYTLNRLDYIYYFFRKLYII